MAILAGPGSGGHAPRNRILSHQTGYFYFGTIGDYSPGTDSLAAARLYRPGHQYLKAGVGLIELVDRNHYQDDLFYPGQPGKTDRLIRAIDAINRTKGKGSVFLAAQGASRPWYMRQQYTSPEYTTR